jgi:cytochrome c biogenesis protein ResB
MIDSCLAAAYPALDTRDRGVDVKKLLKWLKSMKLAAGLLAYLAISGGLATLIPQGLEAAYYEGTYPRLLALVILQSGFSHFFTSLLFLIPSFLFFANLSTCAVDRVLRELRKQGGRRHGPDILHLGLMILVLGAVLSFSARQEGSVVLAVGDSVELPDGRSMKLTQFDYRQYKDGRPQDWISTVDVTREGKTEIEAFPIRVNHPLKLGSMSVYQATHSIATVLTLQDPEGQESRLGQGEEATFGGTRANFMATDPATGEAILRISDGASSPEIARVRAGKSAGPFAVIAFEDIDLTGLEAAIDPGFGLVLAALIIVLAGLFLTFFQKLGDMKP